MDTPLLIEKFQRMGARLKLGDLGPFWPPAVTRAGPGVDADDNRYRIAVDIRRDDKGEFFEVRLPRTGAVDLDVIDVRPRERHLLLMARPHADGNDANARVPADRKQKFLCGHDERSWFVAAVPEKAGASNVPTAMAALKPFAVRASEAREQLPASHRNRRKNRAFVRQGEWFFVPVTRRNFVVDEKLVLRNEPLVRSGGGARGGGKPHWAELCFRTGGRNVYVGPRQYGVMEEGQYKALVTAKPHLKRSFRLMRRDAAVYVKGKVRHPDHKTITLHDWHEVQMNTETQAKAMRHVVFLD